MVYFFMAAQLFDPNNESDTYDKVNSILFSGGLSKAPSIGKKFPIEFNEFKLGNIDSLMHTNELMIKLDIGVETLLKKIERQYLDTTGEQAYEFKIETKDSKCSIEKYIFEFKWDEIRYSRKQQINTLAAQLQQRVTQIDNDIRSKSQNYNDAKTLSLSTAKKEGSLQTRDLTDIFKKEFVHQDDFIYTSSITTLVCIVHKNKSELFMKNYQFISQNVIPGTLRYFDKYEDKDGYMIYRVQLFRRFYDQPVDVPPEKANKFKSPVEEFASICRDKYSAIVREFEYKPQDAEKKDQERIASKAKADQLSVVLKQQCEKSFSDLYITYIHLKVLRLTVDVAMRFGVNDPCCICLVKPQNGKEKKVQSLLLNLFTDPSQRGLYGTKEELEDTEDFFPFVYIPITVG